MKQPIASHSIRWECLHVWWRPWSSKPAWGLNKAPSGFDSHTLPLEFKLLCGTVVAESLKIKAVIETAIYVDDLDATEAFYGTTLGLRVIGKEPGHHVFFQAGEASVLLAFMSTATLKGDRLPP